MDETRTRRLRIYLFSPELLADLCRWPEGRVVEVRSHPMPADARVCGVAFDEMRGCFLLRVESAEFAEVPEGEVIPYAESPAFRIFERSWHDRPPLL